MNRPAMWFMCVWIALLLCPRISHGHNLSLGTLTINQSVKDEGNFTLVLQVSGDQGSHLESSVLPPSACAVIGHVVEQKDEIRLRVRQTLQCEVPGLTNKQFQFSGLPSDANMLIRALRGGELVEERLLTGNITSWEISAGSSRSDGVFFDYTVLGIEHILIGWDHLLFLVMLMLLVPIGWKLVQVITAFTLGHSITLASATLDVISVPIPPTEALVALSIVFLAAEVIRFQRYRIKTLTVTYPGIVVALFGLFHGLGFASVLGEIGLPENQILYSLLAFNIGVELGQLLFVTVLLMVGHLVGRFAVSFPYKQVAAYLGGSLGAFWLIERVAGF